MGFPLNLGPQKGLWGLGSRGVLVKAIQSGIGTHGKSKAPVLAEPEFA